MEWIRENWMYVPIAAIFIPLIYFNYRIRRSLGGHENSHGHEGNPGESSSDGAKKSGHGCCG
jgi:hypothetical protein